MSENLNIPLADRPEYTGLSDEEIARQEEAKAKIEQFIEQAQPGTYLPEIPKELIDQIDNLSHSDSAEAISKRKEALVKLVAFIMLVSGALSLQPPTRGGELPGGPGSELEGTAGVAVLRPGESPTNPQTIRIETTTPGTVDSISGSLLDKMGPGEYVANKNILKKAIAIIEKMQLQGFDVTTRVKGFSSDFDGPNSLRKKEDVPNDASDNRSDDSAAALETELANAGISGVKINKETFQDILSKKEFEELTKIATEHKKYTNAESMITAVMNGSETPQEYIDAYEKYIKDKMRVKITIIGKRKNPDVTVVTTIRTDGKPGTPGDAMVYYNVIPGLGINAQYLDENMPPMPKPTEPPYLPIDLTPIDQEDDVVIVDPPPYPPKSKSRRFVEDESVKQIYHPSATGHIKIPSPNSGFGKPGGHQRGSSSNQNSQPINSRTGRVL